MDSEWKNTKYVVFTRKKKDEKIFIVKWCEGFVIRFR